MKSKLNYLPMLIAALAALGMFSSCHKADTAYSDYQLLGDRVSQQILAGRPDSAVPLVRSEIQRAIARGDSDHYYNAMLQLAVVDYYTARPAEMMDRLDSIESYLAKFPRTRGRMLLNGKMNTLRASYFMRFTFMPDSNIFYCRRALDFFADVKEPEMESDAYLNLAEAYRNNGMLDMAADCYGRAIQIADSAGFDDRIKAPRYVGIASVYTDLMDFDSSERWWRRAASTWGCMAPEDRFHYLNNRGHDYYMRHDYDESLKYFLRLDSLLADQPAMVWERNFGRVNLADVYLRLGSPDKASRLLDSAERYFTEVQPNPYVQDQLRVLRLRQANARGQYAAVADMLRQWPDDGTGVRPEQRSEMMEFLKDYYTGTNQWHKAFLAETQYRQYTDSLRNHALRLSASERQMRYERDSALQALNKDLEAHKKILSRNYMLGAFALVVILLLITVVILLKRISQHREEQLLHRITTLRLESLRARINPHFIYNVLNDQLLGHGQDQPSGIERLIRLLRRQAVMADELAVTLSDELQFIDDYASLQADSTDSPSTYECDIAPDIDPESVMVPSMALQIFVENAFKHGFAQLPPDAPRILRISAIRAGDNYVISVMNNAAPDGRPSSQSTRQGLKIVAGTIEALNDKKRDKIRFDIEPWTDNPEHSGYCASLIIPVDFNFNIHGKQHH